MSKRLVIGLFLITVGLVLGVGLIIHFSSKCTENGDLLEGGGTLGRNGKFTVTMTPVQVIIAMINILLFVPEK